MAVIGPLSWSLACLEYHHLPATGSAIEANTLMNNAGAPLHLSTGAEKPAKGRLLCSSAQVSGQCLWRASMLVYIMHNVMAVVHTGCSFT